MSSDRMEDFERIVTEYAGPLGKFIVKKQFNSLTKDFHDLTEEEKRKLINVIVEKSIYNPDRAKELRTVLLKKFLN